MAEHLLGVELIDHLLFPRDMPKITKCQRDLAVTGLTASGLTRLGYLDIAEQLSKINRKKFDQGMAYGVADARFVFAPSVAYDTIQIELSVAGDTWAVHNAHVKAKSLWTEMNDLVLEDNPSVAGKWSDFKVYLDGTHRTLSVAGNALQSITSESIPVLAGEWNYSDYVLPQHDVDPVTGEPKVADQTHAHLLGDDLGNIATEFYSVGLVKAYAESRATVSANQPNVPGGMPTSFFNLLTDSGSQEPELALVVEAENDNPPYALDDYPGGEINSIDPWIVSISSSNTFAPVGTLTGFVAQCGLVKVVARAYLNGVAVLTPDMQLLFSIAPGYYKGVAAIPMGQ